MSRRFAAKRTSAAKNNVNQPAQEHEVTSPVLAVAAPEVVHPPLDASVSTLLQQLQRERPTDENPDAVKRIVPLYPEFGQFRICYVQPDPLPAHVEFLLRLKMHNLELVKIPIDHKTDRIFVRSCIEILLHHCGVELTYIRELITLYNEQTPMSDSEATTTESTSSFTESTMTPKQLCRKKLLNLLTLARDYCKHHNIEFAVDPVD